MRPPPPQNTPPQTLVLMSACLCCFPNPFLSPIFNKSTELLTGSGEVLVYYIGRAGILTVTMLNSSPLWVPSPSWAFTCMAPFHTYIGSFTTIWGPFTPMRPPGRGLWAVMCWLWPSPHGNQVFPVSCTGTDNQEKIYKK